MIDNFIFVMIGLLLERYNYTQDVMKIKIQNRLQFLDKLGIRLTSEQKKETSVKIGILL